MRPVFYRVTLVLLVFTSEAAFAANPDNGSTLAQRWCAACHVVSDSQSKGTDIAPSFASIAARPDFNVEKLVYFLLEPHPKMPNMSLSRDEAKDLSAYIGEQRR
jgi:mono/diheme cytochrome c family protein